MANPIPANGPQIEFRDLEDIENIVDKAMTVLSTASAVWSLIESDYADALFWGGTAVSCLRKINPELESFLKRIEGPVETAISVNVNYLYLAIGLGTVLNPTYPNRSITWLPTRLSLLSSKLYKTINIG